jgi:hypothetical protein
MKKNIRIGCGAGFSGDRLEPAVLLAEKGELDYLVLECLAERTIALAQKKKRQDPSKGYDPLFERRMGPLLPLIADGTCRLITNMGAANPMAAAKVLEEMAKQMGLHVTIAAVSGDDVLHLVDPLQPAIETGAILQTHGQLISANAYLGIEAILPGLEQDADVIITGRVADPSLFLAPMVHAFGWDHEDWGLMGKGTVTGHLLECAGQVTGGYFADGIKKQVPELAILGHPIAEVNRDGSSVITKLTGTGGAVNLLTVKEQLLYEVTNPCEYYTPDVIADFSTVHLKEPAIDRIEVNGGSGRPCPDTYKVSVGYHAHFLGEGEISYAGRHALERAKLAAWIIRERLSERFDEIRCDYIGSSSVHHTDFGHPYEPYEIRLRVAAKAATWEEAAVIGEEVEALYTNGPAGGGGVRKYVQEVVGIVSTLIERSKVKPVITLITT